MSPFRTREAREPCLAALASIVALALLVLAVGADAAPPDDGGERPVPPGLIEDERNTIAVFRRASPAVVFVTNTRLTRDVFSLNVTAIPRGSGSGFVWDRQGHVVTNFHVIQGGNALTVTFADGSRHPAIVVGTEPRKDLAVLRVEGAIQPPVPLELGDSEHLVVGQKVLAIGNPFGLDRTLTTGIISALGREISSPAGVRIEDVIQTDASINPGNSGGPLLDSSGRLVGVTTAIFSPNGASAGIGFAVPVAAVQRVVPQLIRFGRVKRASLGVTVLPDHLVERWGLRGVVVRDVVRDGPAARAGVRPLAVDETGAVRLLDRIVGVGGRDVATFADLAAALDAHEPGDVVAVRIVRDGRETTVDVTLAEGD